MRARDVSVIFSLLLAATAAATAAPLSQPGWTFQLEPPAGWRAQAGPGGAILGHDTIAGAILVYPHTFPDEVALRAAMLQGVTEGDMQLAPTEAPARGPDGHLRAGVHGIQQGTPLAGRCLGARVGAGGAILIAISTPQGYGPALGEAMEATARSLRPAAGAATGVGGAPGAAGTAGTAGTQGLAAAFAGTWQTMTTNTQTTVTLRPDGTYVDGYESSYSGNFTDSGGADLGSWGTAGQSQGAGRWSVQGTRESGVLVLMPQGDAPQQIPFRVHVERGQVYWNEYYFGGSLYSRVR